jgi:hypothetical protein
MIPKPIFRSDVCRDQHVLEQTATRLRSIH